MTGGAILRVEGRRGQCDRKCHTSPAKRCRCICGGRFHGIGVEPAWDAMRDAVAAGDFGPDARMTGRAQLELDLGGDRATADA